MIANKDYLLIKAIKKAKCCCDGKSDGGDDQPQVTLKKFAELTINDINYMMDYPEDLPVCDVMVWYNETTNEDIIIDTIGNSSIYNINYYFSTEEKALEAIQYGSYGYGLEGISYISGSATVEENEINGTIVYSVNTVPVG